MTVESIAIDNQIIGEEFFYDIQLMKAQAEYFNHQFQWAEDYPGKLKKIYRYNSARSIQDFIDIYYSKLNRKDKNCNEIVHGSFYMYFDLDVKINLSNSDFTDYDLYIWFDSVYREFVNYTIANCSEPEIEPQADDASYIFRPANLAKTSLNLLLPNWIVTTASDSTKLSLHLINDNVIFQDLSFFKALYKAFESFLESFVPAEHPFKNAFDISVSSKNRAMRLCESAKLESDRYLKVHPEIHPLGMKLTRTFITNAINDPKIKEKIFAKELVDIAFPFNPTNHNPKTIKHFEYPTNNKDSDDQIRELLALLSNKRADERQYWLDIAFIFKYHNLPYHLFEEFSRRSNKFDPVTCKTFFDDLELKPTDKPITLGTLHFYAKQDNPEKYKVYKQKYQIISIDLPFTPNQIINEKFIPKELYFNLFSAFDLIALKSCMMTGKTYALPYLFKLPNYDSIVVVFFRVSLSKELAKKWKDERFFLYSDIKEKSIDLKKYPRLIIQIDSLPRIHGKTDLLVLDEIESTYTHLCGFNKVNHQACFNSLKNYIQQSPKVLLADANLSDETVDVLLKKRLDRTVRVQNNYQSFSHFDSYFLHSKEQFLDIILTYLQSQKKIVIPTNSKSFADSLEQTIHKSFPDLKVLSINVEKNQQIEVSEWGNYDVLIYTPTIVAGVSFDQTHFDICCAYFINQSCSAEMCSQMLHRVRHLKDNKLFLCVPMMSQKSTLPITNKEIAENVKERIHAGDNYLASEGLEIDQFDERVTRNEYFQLYCAYKRKSNLSELYFEAYLKQIFKFHGIKIHKHDPTDRYTAEKQDELFNLLQSSKKENKLQKAKDIVDAIPISTHIYHELLNSKKEKSQRDQLSISRHYLTSTMRIPHDTNLTGKETWVKNTFPYLKGINNSKEFISKPIQQSIELTKKRHQENYDRDLWYQASEYKRLGGSDDSDNNNADTSDDEKCIKQYRNVRKKKNIKQVIVHSIHYDRKWLKIQICLEMLKAAGYTILESNIQIRLNWDAMLRYCRENEKTIRALFENEKKEWKEQIDNFEKISLMQYINTKLKTMLAIKLKSTSSKGMYHIIEPCYDLFNTSVSSGG